MSLTLITPPTVEPVTLAEAKLHLRVDHSADDDLIATLIAAAREQCEHVTGQALITQTWERVLDAFPAVELELGKAPAASIASVTYIDPDGSSRVLDPGAYTLDGESNLRIGFALPAQGTTWPDTLDTANAVRVRFVAGFGADESAVPGPLRAWMKLRIGSLYQHRSEIAAGVSLAELPGGFADRLLDAYRTWRL